MIQQRKVAGYCNTKAATKQQPSADYIKQRLAPRDFYRYAIPCASFKRQGWNEGDLCPFHDDNKPGSFRINVLTGAYKCFACGAAGGDVIAFAMAFYELQFVDALAKLTDDWGLAW